jgi:arylsulfatase A-like enzyme
MSKRRMLRFLIFSIFAVLLIFSALIYLKIKPSYPKHVILISIDTLRADHLGCYNNSRNISPETDAFSNDCLLFENAFTHVPLTLPSHSTMLSGTLPLFHQVRDNEHHLNDSVITLAEMFQNKGFTTCGIVSSSVLDKSTGIAQGFDFYNDDYEETMKDTYFIGRRAEETTALASEWLAKNHKKNFFLFLHYYDPHIPYDPPGELAEIFADDPYSGEVNYVDKHIGLLIQKIKSLGLYEDSLIILTADHGEMLGEHGESEHGFFIYESAIRVPLLVKLPGRHPARRIPWNVGLVDIAPTICRAAGLDISPQFQGYDLQTIADIEASDPLAERYLYCETLFPTRYGAASIFGVVYREWRYIQTIRPELYDVNTDPMEQNNLVVAEQKRTHLLKSHLLEIIEEKKDQTGPATLSYQSANEEKLASLGYLAGERADIAVSLDQRGADPKDQIVLYEQQKTVDRLMRQQQFPDAKKICEKMVSAQPENSHFIRTLANICFELKQWQQAEELYNKFLSIIKPDEDRYLKLHPKRLFDVYSELAEIYYQQNNLQQSIKCLEKCLTIHPEDTSVRNRISYLRGVIAETE